MLLFLLVLSFYAAKADYVHDIFDSTPQSASYSIEQDDIGAVDISLEEKVHDPVETVESALPSIQPPQEEEKPEEATSEVETVQEAEDSGDYSTSGQSANAEQPEDVREQPNEQAREQERLLSDHSDTNDIDHQREQEQEQHQAAASTVEVQLNKDAALIVDDDEELMQQQQQRLRAFEIEYAEEERLTELMLTAYEKVAFENDRPNGHLFPRDVYA